MPSFTDPKILKLIGPRRLLRFLVDFSGDLTDARISLPDYDPDNDEPYFASLASLFSSSALPEAIRLALDSLEFVAAAETTAHLDREIERWLPNVSLPPSQPPIDRALELWFWSHDAVINLARALQAADTPPPRSFSVGAQVPESPLELHPETETAPAPAAAGSAALYTAVTPAPPMAERVISCTPSGAGGPARRSASDAGGQGTPCAPSSADSQTNTSGTPSLPITKHSLTDDQRLEFVQRLADPEQIIRIGTYFLDQFLDRFKPELTERHITHPIRLGDQTKVLNAYSGILAHPEQLPPNMVNALLAILEFSAPHNRRLCEKLAGDAGIDTSRVPEGWALALWLRAPYDLQYVKTLQAHIPDNFYDNDIEYEDIDESPNRSAISPTSSGPAQPANGSAASPAPAVPAFEVSPCPRNKIARLPKDVRNAINEMIAQGLTYHEILHHLGDAGKTLNKSSLWRWKKGPYQRWLKNQERLDESRAQLKFALDAVRQNENNQIHQATQQIAALRISEIFTQFDLQALKEALLEKPDTLVRLAQLLPKLSQGGLQCERQRHELTQAAPAAPAQRPHGPLKLGISNKALRYAERKLRLM